jgi:hypothetical protein
MAWKLVMNYILNLSCQECSMNHVPNDRTQSSVCVALDSDNIYIPDITKTFCLSQNF